MGSILPADWAADVPVLSPGGLLRKNAKMDGLIHFLFVRSLFLGIRLSKNIKQSDIKILVYTPHCTF